MAQNFLQFLDYEKIVTSRFSLDDFDPIIDFYLLFGAA